MKQHVAITFSSLESNLELDCTGGETYLEQSVITMSELLPEARVRYQ